MSEEPLVGVHLEGHGELTEDDLKGGNVHHHPAHVVEQTEEQMDAVAPDDPDDPMSTSGGWADGTTS